MDLLALKDRYQRDEMPIRLGNLASTLSRLAWFLERYPQSAGLLFEEAKNFAEWTVADAPSDVQAMLAELQLHLAIWERRCSSGHAMMSLAPEAQQWSKELLVRSGLAA